MLRERSFAGSIIWREANDASCVLASDVDASGTSARTPDAGHGCPPTEVMHRMSPALDDRGGVLVLDASTDAPASCVLATDVDASGTSARTPDAGH